MKTLKVLKYVGFGILGLGFVILAVFITMSLWNWLIPLLFHGPVLTFWQTAGLFHPVKNTPYRSGPWFKSPKQERLENEV